MIIERKIKVKVIVTEAFKKQLLQDVQAGIQQLDTEISYFEQRYKKVLTELTIKASMQAQGMKEQIEWEKKKREDTKAGFLEQMKKISTLEEGIEVAQGEVSGPAELKVGDQWEKIMNREIVLKDGIIVEIR